MVDRDRVLAKLDEVDGYLDELRSVTPRDLEEYARIEKKRSCDEKLVRRGVISEGMTETLRRMKGMRNLLVHEYGRIDDALVFETVRDRLADFGAFRREVLDFLRCL